MTFSESLHQFAERAVSISHNIKSEASTNISLVLPFLELLGYNIKDPTEVYPEYPADYTVAQGGRRVDFAVLKNGVPIILVESKWVGKQLTIEQSGVQLFQYFNASDAYFGILTNGLVYRFYTDTKKVNIMDDGFIFEIDLANLDNRVSDILDAFRKDNFNPSIAKQRIVEYSLRNQLYEYISHQLANFDDNDLVSYFLRKTGIYNSHKDDVSTYRDTLKSVFSECMNECVNAQAIESEQSTESALAETAKSAAIQKVISTVREMFNGDIVAEKLRHWETNKGTTIAYCECVLCKLFFRDNGNLHKMLFMTDDGTYPRKVKCYKEIPESTDFTQFRELFLAQIEQIRQWDKEKKL